MQLFGLPNAAKDLKNKKNILKRNLTLCIVFAMYIAPQVLECVTVAFVRRLQCAYGGDDCF